MTGHIADTADVSADAVIGAGSQIWHLAQVRENVVLGDDCIVGRGAYIGTGVRVGANSKIQNYALVYEPADLGIGVFIGPAAVLTNDQYPRAVNPDGTRKDGHDWEPVGVTCLEGASIGARGPSRRCRLRRPATGRTSSPRREPPRCRSAGSDGRGPASAGSRLPWSSSSSWWCASLCCGGHTGPGRLNASRTGHSPGVHPAGGRGSPRSCRGMPAVTRPPGIPAPPTGRSAARPAYGARPSRRRRRASVCAPARRAHRASASRHRPRRR